MRYRPAGYVGINHEVIGSDILSILNAVHFPEAVLGEETTAQLRGVDPQVWYPVAWMLEMEETLGDRLGVGGLLKMGKQAFKISHEDRFILEVSSARQLLDGLDAMYRRANRGHEIGGWWVVSFSDGVAVVQKNTPHHCAVEEGILAAALTALGVSASVRQSQCIRKGDGVCEFKIESAARGPRWTGEQG